jgi:hypothetical protein
MMIKFIDICFACKDHESQLDLWHSNSYQMLPGDYCLVLKETARYIHFLSGNAVLWLDKEHEDEKYEYCT